MKLLSNEKSRAQYDSINSLSSDIKNDYNFARSLIEEGDLPSGIRKLEKILELNSGLLIVKSMLAEAYLRNDNSGKALKLFEELTVEEPGNAAFAGYLANAYLARGWQKKTIKAYEKAIALDSDNISLRIGLCDAYIKNNQYWEARHLLENAADSVKDTGENTTIYLRLIMLDISFGMISSIHKSLEKLVELASGSNEVRDNVAWTLTHIAKYFLHTEKLEEAKSIIDKAAELLPEDQNILQTKKEIANFKQYIKEFEKLDNDKRISKEVVGTIAFEILPNSMLEMNDSEKEASIFFHEYTIIEDYEKFRRSTQNLKKDYPDLYAIKSDFYNKAANIIERKKLQAVYRKQLINYKHVLDTIFETEEDDDDYYAYDYEDDWDEDYEPQEPFVREEIKVGRNDPCPCGR